MISRGEKVVYIHITKCGGSSIEDMMGRGAASAFEPDYDRAIGWCPKRRIFMQHATPKELVETGLLTEEEWDQFSTFVVVRDPTARALSAYFWLIADLKLIRGASFADFLQKTGAFHEPALNTLAVQRYRGPQWRPQSDYFDLGTLKGYDHIFFLREGLEPIRRFLLGKGFSIASTPHKKLATRRPFRSPRDFLSKREMELLRQKFATDYEFLDTRADTPTSILGKALAMQWKLANRRLLR